MNCIDVIKIVKRHGWVLNRVKGSHYHFKNSAVEGLITIPFHRKKSLHPGILRNISRSTGISF